MIIDEKLVEYDCPNCHIVSNTLCKIERRKDLQAHIEYPTGRIIQDVWNKQYIVQAKIQCPICFKTTSINLRRETGNRKKIKILNERF